MKTFEQRQKAYEAKFVQDEEKIFKIRSRRRKFLGLWAGEKMHMNEEECLAYALEIVSFGVGQISIEDIAKKVFEDINNSGVEINLEKVEEKMDQLFEKAVKSLEKEGEI